MPQQVYVMTDEELSLFNDKFAEICTALEGTPLHLVTPLLIRVTITSYFNIKGLEPDKITMQLAQTLAADLGEVLITTTNRHITERN